METIIFGPCSTVGFHSVDLEGVWCLALTQEFAHME